jgi:type IV pilus assembly protein PilA
MSSRRVLALREEAGFTLIELMMVVLIIGILIAIGLPTFLGAKHRAANRAAQTELRLGITAGLVHFDVNLTFNGFDAPAARVIEPGLVWMDAVDPVNTRAIAIAYASGGELVIVRHSTSGRYFCASERPNTPGFARGNGPTYASVDTVAECTGDW